MDELKHSRHCVGGSNYHLQLTPKYRKRVFEVYGIRSLIRALLRRKAIELGVKVEAIEFGPEHLHMFVSNCRKYSVSTLLHHLKGYSSWYIRRELPRELSRFYWGDSFWTDGYFYESIGRVTTETVQFYIERQQKKHWTHDTYETGLRKDVEKRTGQTQLDMFAS